MTHLATLQQLHQKHFKSAYGMEHKPKHHHRLHLDAQYLRAKVVLSCEPLEHKHSLYKSGLGDRQKSLVHEHGAFAASILPRMLQTCHDLIRKTGLPFWQLLPPIAEASIDDKIFFATAELKTSKRSLESFFHFMFEKRCLRCFSFRSLLTLVPFVCTTCVCFNFSGCYLVANSMGPGDIIIWRKCGGIIREWFCTREDGLFVRCQKLDLATRIYDQHCMFLFEVCCFKPTTSTPTVNR